MILDDREAPVTHTAKDRGQRHRLGSANLEGVGPQMKIDTSFDFRTDSGGRDADAFSPTLRLYHQQLWSKALPGGMLFRLDKSVQKPYLNYHSTEAELLLSSDTVIPTFHGQTRMLPIFEEMPASEIEEFARIRHTIGGMLVWPAKRVGSKMTINGARGFNGKIKDRMDLTLECVRRYYLHQDSPLRDVLARYHRFFDLFHDFHGYVEFFHLQYLMTSDPSIVEFSLPFDDFHSSALPLDLESYQRYRHRSMRFIEARNRRIDLWVKSWPPCEPEDVPLTERRSEVVHH